MPKRSDFLLTERSEASALTSSIKAINYDIRYYGNDKDYINDVIGRNGYGRTGGFTPGGDGWKNDVRASFVIGNASSEYGYKAGAFGSTFVQTGNKFRVTAIYTSATEPTPDSHTGGLIIIINYTPGRQSVPLSTFYVYLYDKSNDGTDWNVGVFFTPDIILTTGNLMSTTTEADGTVTIKYGVATFPTNWMNAYNGEPFLMSFYTPIA